MSKETEAIDFITQLLSMDDKDLEQGLPEIIKLFEQGVETELAVNEKIAYCKANNLSEDDLIKENQLALETLKDEISMFSPIKQKLMSYLLNGAVLINESVIKRGLFGTSKLRIQRLSKEVRMPAYAHERGDSGMDIYLPEDIIVPATSTIIAKTGFKVVVPLGYELQIRPRSGNSLKPEYLNLFVANSPGTIDANYREEVGVILRNIGDTPIAIVKGTRIAQMVMAPVVLATIEEIPSVSAFPSERTGGFGSSGS